MNLLLVLLVEIPAVAPFFVTRRHAHVLVRRAEELDGPSSDEFSDEAVLEVAKARVLHSGIYSARLFDVDGVAEENRLFLDAAGKASAVRDVYGRGGGGSGRGGARSGLWRVEAVEGRQHECALTIVLGRYSLLAVAETRRAAAPIRGTVLEGEVDGDFAGRFEMVLATPATNATVVAEQLRRSAAKLATRPAPPPRYTRADFANRRKWLLDAVLEGERAAFVVELRENGTFVDAAVEGGTIGGRWGVYDEGAERKSADGAGTHLWLWIRRSNTRGFNLHGDLRLHGRPSYDGGASLQRELAARSGAPPPPPDRVQGHVIFGDIPDMEYSCLIGSFELTPAALPAPLLGRLPIPSAF